LNKSNIFEKGWIKMINRRFMMFGVIMAFGFILLGCKDDPGTGKNSINVANQDSYVFNFEWTYNSSSNSETLKWVRKGTAIKDITEARSEVNTFVENLGNAYITKSSKFVSIADSYNYTETYEYILNSSKVCWDYSPDCKAEFANDNWLGDIFHDGDFILTGGSSTGISTDENYPFFLLTEAVFADDKYVYWWVLAVAAKSRTVVGDNNYYELTEYRMKR
jgi:hypothetical protein